MKFALIYPMFAMVLLTFTVVIGLFRSRVASVASGNVSASYFKTYSTTDVEPESSLKFSRHFINLFEVPTLFYAGCIAFIATAQTDVIAIALAWVYVGCRIVHAVVHTGSNRMKLRIRAYFLGWLVLLALWVYLVARVAVTT